MIDDAIEVAETQETPPVPRRRRGLLIGAIAGGAVLVAGGGAATAYAVLAAQHAPQQYVTSFLQHLTDGEASLALAWVSDIPAQDALLTDAAYATATDRVSAFAVGDAVITDDGHATVTTTITQGAQEYEQDFTLTRVGREFLFDVWAIDGGQLPTFQVAFPRPDSVVATANGVALGDVRFDAVPALPGTYEFGATGLTDFFTVTPVTETVTFENSETATNVPLSVALTEAGVNAAQLAVAAHTDACLAQPVLAPTGGCGFSINDDDPATLVGQRWTLVERPTVTFGEWTGVGDEVGWPVIPGAAGHLTWYADVTYGGWADARIDDYMPDGFIQSFDDAGTAIYVSRYE